MSTWRSATWGTTEFGARIRKFATAALGEDLQIELLSHRPWSAVWRVQSASVTAFAKQNCPGQAHEARLMARLATREPDLVVPVLAANSDADLLLTEDAGPTMREAGRGGDLELWCELVARSTDLQRSTAEALDNVGLTALAPVDAPTYVADAVGRLAALAEADPRRLDGEIAVRLERLLPTVGDWADELDALRLPMTLVHNDLHDANVVPQPGGVRFLDFGDAVLAHPLTNLLVPLRAAAAVLEVGRDDVRLHRIADAGLEVWSDLVPMPELRVALPAGLRMGCVARVESWRRCVATMDTVEQASYGDAPAAWLGMLLEPPPLGS